MLRPYDAAGSTAVVDLDTGKVKDPYDCRQDLLSALTSEPLVPGLTGGEHHG